MRYVVARLDEYGRDMTYRFYIADTLQNAPQGKYLKTSLRDLIYPDITSSKSADEIVFDVITKAGLSFKE